MMLRSRSEGLKHVVERVFARHCPYGLYILNSELLDHLVQEMESVANISFTEAMQFEHFSVLLNGRIE